MNEQANKVLAEMLQKASSGLDAAVSFSQAQIPDVVHQLLVWNAVSSALFQVFALAVFIGYLLTIKKASLVAGDFRNKFDVAASVYLAVGGVAAFSMFIAFWGNFDWLKIWLAPKLYLIEYAAGLMK
ncbi:hypothetical protein ACCC84_10315 [Serratia odorifera]|uniref:hypothetical protein n=1 Tax=Serratia odorifera TaxID=618 RepID=UPI0035325312